MFNHSFTSPKHIDNTLKYRRRSHVFLGSQYRDLQGVGSTCMGSASDAMPAADNDVGKEESSITLIRRTQSQNSIHRGVSEVAELFGDHDQTALGVARMHMHRRRVLCITKP